MDNKQANVERFNARSGDWDDDPKRVRMVQGVTRAKLGAEFDGFHREVQGVVHHSFAREEIGGWLRDAGFDEVRFSTAYTVRREAIARKPVA